MPLVYRRRESGRGTEGTVKYCLVWYAVDVETRRRVCEFVSSRMSAIGAVVSFGASSDGQFEEHDDLLGRHILATAASTAGIASLDKERGVAWLWGGVVRS